MGTGNKFLYLYGGNTASACAKIPPRIYKYSYINGGTVNQLKTIDIKGSYVGTLEAEGIKVENDFITNKEKIFIGMKPGFDDSGALKPYRLYSFTEPN